MVEPLASTLRNLAHRSVDFVIAVRLGRARTERPVGLSRLRGQQFGEFRMRLREKGQSAFDGRRRELFGAHRRRLCLWYGFAIRRIQFRKMLVLPCQPL